MRKKKTTGTRCSLKDAIRRMRDGYCDRDVWEMDEWFLTVVPRMLLELRENSHGFPFRVGDMVGYDAANPEEEKEKAAEEKWKAILAEMAFYLQEAGKEGPQEYRDECKNKGLQLFSEWFWELWD